MTLLIESIKSPLFERRTPDNIPAQAIAWLNDTKRQTLPVDMQACIKNCASKNIHIYTIESGGELCACFCLLFNELPYGRVMNLVRLAGKNVSAWKDGLVKFLESTAVKEGCVDFVMMGPLAWKKLFPMLQLSTCVFKKPFNLTSKNKTIE